MAVSRGIVVYVFVLAVKEGVENTVSLVIREDLSFLIFMLVFTVLKKRKQSQPSNSSVILTTEVLG